MERSQLKYSKKKENEMKELNSIESMARYWGEWVESAEVMVEQLKVVFKLLRNK